MPNKSLRDHFSIIAYGGVSLLLFLLISLGRKKIKNNFSISVFGAILYLIILVIVNLLIYKINLALLFTIPTALMILYFSFNLGELSSVMEKTYNIIYIIALTSLIIFIPYVLLGILDAPTLFPFLRNNWTQYAPSFYIYSYPQGNRNCAFFYEAPKYNVILTLALAYSCYIKKECLTFKNIIIFCTILSAQSVTGILLSIFIIVTKAIFESDHYKIGKNNIILIYIKPHLKSILNKRITDIFDKEYLIKILIDAKIAHNNESNFCTAFHASNNKKKLYFKNGRDVYEIEF